MEKDTDHNPLAQLLRRGDVWRGNNTPVADQQNAWDTGHRVLNEALRFQGWPLSQLIEVCQSHTPYCEWLLWGPLVAHSTTHRGIAVLLNPPATPLLSGLSQHGVKTSSLWLVQTSRRQDFLPTLQELLSADCISTVLAWEPKQALSYTELRKVQLSCAQNKLCCCVFRSHKQRQHSSPAALRLEVKLHIKHVHIDIFKQKGHMQQHSLALPLPDKWHPQWQAPNTQTQSDSARVIAFPVNGQTHLKGPIHG